MGRKTNHEVMNLRKGLGGVGKDGRAVRQSVGREQSELIRGQITTPLKRKLKAKAVVSVWAPFFPSAFENRVKKQTVAPD